jgi:hypothetical protein
MVPRADAPTMYENNVCNQYASSVTTDTSGDIGSSGPTSQGVQPMQWELIEW